MLDTPPTCHSPLTKSLEYAARGWPVLPLFEASPRTGCSCLDPRCGSPGKHPRISGGYRGATTDPDRIREWERKWPAANVAIATGDGRLVVDVDPRNGGDASLVALEREHGPLETYCVRTGSGGKHFYYQYPTQHPIRGRNAVWPGIDIKADGGYVVAPPSLHASGRHYEVVDDREVAVAPQWLLDALGEGLGDTRPSECEPSDLAAPGSGLVERFKWTREAAQAIPNDAVFSDRDRWVGVAHAIRSSCGEGGESDAFEIFDDFSSRWTEGTYDPDETERVWGTLPESKSSGGYPKLLRLARVAGYEIPADHPWHPQNEFSAHECHVDWPARLDALNWHWAGLDQALLHARSVVAALPLGTQPIAEAKVLRHLREVTLSASSAQELWKGAQSIGTSVAVEVRNGQTIMRAADPADGLVGCQYLVHGLIPAGAVGELIADFSTGKTFLLLQLALCVGLGVPFFGREVDQKPVIYMAYEGQAGLWKRIAGVAYSLGLIPEQFSIADLRDLISDRVIMIAIPPQFDQVGLESLLRSTILECGAGLAIVDTRGKSLGRDQAEDSADTANEIQSLLSRIAQTTGCTFISAHHTGLRDKSRGRGSSAWTQGSDFAFVIDGGSSTFAASGSMTLRPTKFRDDHWPAPITYRLRSPIAVIVEGTRWATAALEATSRPPREPATDQARVFVAVLRNPGLGLHAVRSAVQGLGSKKVDAALAELFELGAICDDGDRRKHIYRAAPGWEVDGDGQVRHIGDEFLSDDLDVQLATHEETISQVVGESDDSVEAAS